MNTITSKITVAAIFISWVLLISTSLASASETWFIWDSEGAGQFLHKEGKKYTPVYFPTGPDETYKANSFSYYVKDGFWGLGYRKSDIKTLDYNLNMAEIMYYVLSKASLPYIYQDIDCLYTTYTREDINLDFYLTHGPLQLMAGIYLINGSYPFQLEIIDGTACNNEVDFLQYNFLSLFSMYKGYQVDVGLGFGGRFQLTYQPTQALTLSLSGDNIGSDLVWKDVDNYRGIFSLDIVKTDENGFEHIEAPMNGTYSSKSFTIKQEPVWRAEILYTEKNWQVKNWAQYRKNWEYGLTGTLLLRELPDLSLGVSRQHNSWLYEVGLETTNLGITFAINTLDREKQTGYTLNFATHLF